MRIIGGNYRGKKLNTPKDESIRPTTDMVKENLFNIIQSKVAGCTFLDLFAGSGAIGAEALSRGAKKVVFCDKSMDSCRLTTSNSCGLCTRFQVLNYDYKQFLKNYHDEKFDIIYVDPPYKLFKYEDILEDIKQADILNTNGIVICESSRDYGEIKHDDYFALTSARKYGSVSLEFFKRNTRALVMGTFDPITLGHLDIIERAREISDIVYVCIMENSSKVGLFDIATRRKLIEVATKNISGIKVDYYDGMCYQYCLDNAIDVIVRGFRNAKDYEYELEMAKFNQEHADIKTILLPSREEYASISSSGVKEKIEKHEDLSGLVPDNIIEFCVIGR